MHDVAACRTDGSQYCLLDRAWCGCNRPVRARMLYRAGLRGLPMDEHQGRRDRCGGRDHACRGGEDAGAAAANWRRPVRRPPRPPSAGLLPGELVQPNLAGRDHLAGWMREVEQLPDRGEVVDGGHG